MRKSHACIYAFFALFVCVSNETSDSQLFDIFDHVLSSSKPQLGKIWAKLGVPFISVLDSSMPSGRLKDAEKNSVLDFLFKRERIIVGCVLDTPFLVEAQLAFNEVTEKLAQSYNNVKLTPQYVFYHNNAELFEDLRNGIIDVTLPSLSVTRRQRKPVRTSANVFDDVEDNNDIVSLPSFGALALTLIAKNNTETNVSEIQNLLSKNPNLLIVSSSLSVCEFVESVLSFHCVVISNAETAANQILDETNVIAIASANVNFASQKTSRLLFPLQSLILQKDSTVNIVERKHESSETGNEILRDLLDQSICIEQMRTSHLNDTFPLITNFGDCARLKADAKFDKLEGTIERIINKGTIIIGSHEANIPGVYNSAELTEQNFLIQREDIIIRNAFAHFFKENNLNIHRMSFKSQTELFNALENGGIDAISSVTCVAERNRFLHTCSVLAYTPCLFFNKSVIDGNITSVDQFNTFLAGRQLKVLVSQAGYVNKVQQLFPNAKLVEVVTDNDILFDRLEKDVTVAGALPEMISSVPSALSDKIVKLITNTTVPLSFTLRKNTRMSTSYEKSSSSLWILLAFLMFFFSISAFFGIFGLMRHNKKKGKKRSNGFMNTITQTIDNISSYIEQRNEPQNSETNKEEKQEENEKDEEQGEEIENEYEDHRTGYVPPSF